MLLDFLLLLHIFIIIQIKTNIMGNLKISGNTTDIIDWNINNIIDNYLDTCKEIYDIETYGRETSKNNMTYWDVNRFNDWELANEYDNKRI